MRRKLLVTAICACAFMSSSSTALAGETAEADGIEAPDAALTVGGVFDDGGDVVDGDATLIAGQEPCLVDLADDGCVAALEQHALAAEERELGSSA